MTRKLFLRLCLIVFVLTLNSCRQDILPEHETYNNSGAFQLTSKRISLDEAKHKARLLPELEKAEAEFKAKTKNSVFGKTVNYGNGVSIDTDDVIYIENGPNYHTYTFKINRENAPADAPVENLVLSPLSDGTYRELLVSYNLTSQEKQQLKNGLFVDLTGKVISQELASGTYGLNLMGKTTSTQCNWVSATVNVKCPCEGHTLGQECTCPKGKPKQYVITWNVCEDIEDSTPAAGSPASGGGGGTGTLTPPCNENGVSSQPQNPDSTLENQPCNNGTVTLPNLTFNPVKTPCAKLKELINPLKTDLKEQIENEMYPSIDNNPVGEMGIHLKRDANGNIETEIEPLSTDSSSPPKFGGDYYAGGHTHPKSAYPMFTYSDIMVLVKADAALSDHNKGLASRLLFCEDENGVKQTYAIVFESTGNPIQNTWNDPDFIGLSLEKIITELDDRLLKAYDKEYSKTNPNFERFILQYLFGYNVGLYKANSDLTNWSKLSISENSETATVIPTNCN